MSDITYHHPPIPLISGLDDQQAFIVGFPDEWHRLCENAIPFRLSVYRWPELLACLLGNGLGTTIYEITVSVPDNYLEVVNES